MIVAAMDDGGFRRERAIGEREAALCGDGLNLFRACEPTQRRFHGALLGVENVAEFNLGRGLFVEGVEDALFKIHGVTARKRNPAPMKKPASKSIPAK